MAMTFLEEMKDKASRLIPTPFSDIVDEATSDVLIAPDWERIMVICEYANAKTENVTDVVRAVRRRIDNKSSKVQYFTVVLLQSLIKSCGANVHREIAETKGLLRDLVQVAMKDIGRDGDREAKTAALQLLLNMSFWFDRHPSADVAALAHLANYARKQGASFDGLEHEAFTVMQEAPTDRPSSQRRLTQRQAQQVQQQQQQQRGVRVPAAAPQVPRPASVGGGSAPRVVDAIPLESPAEEVLSAMMDNVMLLAECINSAEADPTSSTDVLANVGQQVRAEHRHLALLVSSGVELANMDVLLSISDSQISVVQRLGEFARRQRGPAAPPQTSTSSVPPATVATYAPTYPTPAVAPQLDEVAAEAARIPVPASSVAAPVAAPPPPPPPAAVVARPAAPSIDDLFAGITDIPPPASTPVAAPPPVVRAPHADDPPTEREASRSRPAAFPAPGQSLDPSVPATAAMSHSDGATATSAAPTGSINDDGFESFLQQRMQQ